MKRKICEVRLLIQLIFMKLISVCLLLTIGFMLTAHAAVTEVSLPPTSTTPVIDGKISPGEWRSAARFSGGESSKKLDARECIFLIAYDRKNLYLAVRSELPPGGKLLAAISKNKLNNNLVIKDDAVEFMIMPPEDRPVGPFQKGFFQLLANANGALYAFHHEPGYGYSKQLWKINNLSQAHACEDGFWTAEFKIPLKQMGIETISLPSTWRFLMVRDYKNPWAQVANTPIKNFTNKNNFAILHCNPKAQVVQVVVLPLGKPIEVSVFNPSEKPIEVDVEIKLKGGKIKDEKRVKLVVAAGKTGKISAGENLSKNQPYKRSIRITGPNGIVDFYRQTEYVSMKGKKWNNREAFRRLYLSFNKNSQDADFSAINKIKPISFSGELKRGKGRRGKGKKDKALLVAKGVSLLYDRKHWSIPGAITCWVKSTTRINDREKRLLLSSNYKSDGYMFLQQTSNKVLLGFQYFSGLQKAKYIMVPMEQKTGTWHFYAINLYPDKAELFIDGVMRGRVKFGVKLTAKQLAHIKIGSKGFGINGFMIDDLEVYERTLNEQEITEMYFGTAVNSGKISWFPSLNELIVEMTLDTKKYPVNKTCLELVVVEPDGSKPIFQEPLSLLKNVFQRKDSLLLRQRVKLPTMKSGTFIAYIKLASKNKNENMKNLLERKFIVKHFPWENNKLGTKDIIVPPFTPLKVKGMQVSCILRTYLLNKLGLPDKVFAKGKQILSAPITLTVQADGKKLPWREVAFKFIKKKKTQIIYQCEFQNDLLKCKLAGEFDYDGLLKLDFNLIPVQNKAIERLYLDIPIKPEVAKLFHAVGERTRNNPAGRIPPGKGVVWKSRSLIQQSIENFIPYLWVGAEERGICYAADWDKGWTHSKQRDAVELIREKDRVIIRVNLINGPLVLKKNRNIELALMASPVKPMPKGWRGWSDNYSIWGVPGTKLLQSFGSPVYWGGYYGYMGVYPIFGDYSFINKLAETRNTTGKIDYKFLEKFFQRIMKAEKHEAPGVHIQKRSASLVHDSLLSGLARMKVMHGAPKNVKKIVYPYTCMCARTDFLPENKIYGDEWQYRAMGAAVNSYQDYALYYFGKLFNSGAFNGIYLDNTFFAPKYSWPAGEGYVDNKGIIHPSMGLWRNRRYIKRLATYMVERGMEPFICVHQTNGNVLPTLSFATNSMGMEWKYGDSDFQERFSPDYIRTVNIGRQGGFFPTALDGIYAKGRKKAWLTRTMLACLLPHEIRPTAGIGTDRKTYKKIAGILWNFGIAKSDVIFYAYWDKKTPIKATSKNLLTSAYRRDCNLMLVCGNYGGDGNISINIALKQLGMQKIISAVNAETGAKLHVSGNQIMFSIKKHDLALIEVILK